MSCQKNENKKQLRISVGFCIAFTLIITLLFFAFNYYVYNVYSQGYYFDLNHIQSAALTVYLYTAASALFSAILIIEKFAFNRKLIPLLGLKTGNAKNAVSDKLYFIATLFISACVISFIRIFFINKGQSDFSYLLHEAPNNIIIAFCEEIMFRGYVQNIMIKWLGYIRGVTFTAFLFLLVHLPVRVLLESNTLSRLIYLLFYTLAGGIVFGVIAKRDRCIYGSAFVHFTFNICNYIMLV
ncbi:MAG: CPBP family intramembrane metalloprotease [Oscillospiraceae bacterium]|nr:CPBP family intramembrane metalloprotease [Oscillospiraceae bacterium]